MMKPRPAVMPASDRTVQLFSSTSASPQWDSAPTSWIQYGPGVSRGQVVEQASDAETHHRRRRAAELADGIEWFPAVRTDGADSLVSPRAAVQFGVQRSLDLGRNMAGWDTHCEGERRTYTAIIAPTAEAEKLAASPLPLTAPGQRP
jgi:hypothetical protein